MTERLTAYLGLGSNLGDRLSHLQQARQALAVHPDLEVTASSLLYQSAALGGPAGQPTYLNAVVELRSGFAPAKLLRHCLDVERQLGRIRNQRWGARKIDIDLLLVDDLRSTSENLILPHPRLHERNFVLFPLRELAPELVHPGLGTTIARLAEKLGTDPDLKCLGVW